ncbi:helix-turn-helix domain-containing protein [Anaerocolumna sedimenticola]|uniref:Helix-turn-helix domain-containing protein n=1 Tax=Anaerocolumna sedimenticola TaxID=2696063 RepID=A0A6P1TQZ4_9FIRM|nr:helix-turn-helix transcriptional regulator [Anaerocolumna sedimenticola]QHQ62903.1 helix-turn-helix domain-containing protein [Anaerocolumna sedimenticola]
MDMNNFGERLAVYRQNKNMTQEEFASRMGVTAQAVSKWERGQSLPDIGLINSISNILGIDANEIFGITAKADMTEKDGLFDQKKLLSNICAEPVKLTFGKDIIPAIVEGLKTKLITDKRLQIASLYGILIPRIRIVDDNNLNDKEFQIISYDRVLYREELDLINDSVYTYIMEKLFQICTANYAAIINKHMVKTLIDNLKENYPGVADEVIPEKISYLTVQRVLEGIIMKNQSIHNLIAIIEILEEEVLTKNNNNVNAIVEEILRVINMDQRLTK